MSLKRDDLLEAIDLLDQLAHVMFMATRGTTQEGKARELSDRIGRLNQRVGSDQVSALMELVRERNVVEFPSKR